MEYANFTSILKLFTSVACENSGYSLTLQVVLRSPAPVTLDQYGHELSGLLQKMLVTFPPVTKQDEEMILPGYLELR
jgi:hypothetical protein